MDIQEEINFIKERNRRVEADKAWELSWTRRLVLFVFIYFFSGLWLVLIHDAHPWLKALVPAVGYLFSTFTMPFVKERWIGRRMR